MDWETLRTQLNVGDTVYLETDSPIYRGPYTSSVVAKLEQGIRIAMPLDDGRLVLIPVGTHLRLRLGESDSTAEAVVSDRRGGRERFLEITKLEDATGPDTPEEPIAPERAEAPVLAITSGKGGVGKSTFVVNLAIALEELGKRTCIIDADLGTANVDVLLKLSPPFNLGDVVNGSKHMVEVLVQGPRGVLILPGGSGLRHLTRLPDDAFAELMRQFRALEEYADVILIDTGSGVAPSVTNFVAASSGAVLITTPEPHAVTDAYAMLKVLSDEGHKVPTHLVVNRAQNEREGDETVKRMVYAARRFLQYEVRPLGVIREDAMVARAVRQQVDLMTHFGRTRAAQDIREIAEHVALTFVEQEANASSPRGSTTGFLQRIRSLFPGRPADRSIIGKDA